VSHDMKNNVFLPMFFNKINLYLTFISANKPAVWHCIPMQHPGPFAMAWGIWAIRSGLRAPLDKTKEGDD
jgi:hypothetical protein